jgi:hypothetical protein
LSKVNCICGCEKSFEKHQMAKCGKTKTGMQKYRNTSKACHNELVKRQAKERRIKYKAYTLD